MSSKEAVLVVDDEEVVVEVVAERLKEEGYEVEVAYDGNEALEKLKEKEFALILTDYHMPGVNGIDLIKKVRLNWPDRVAILMTAHNEVEIAVKAMKEGAYDYIPKPFHLEDLTLSVRRALRHRKLEQEAKEYEKQLEERVRQRTQELLEQVEKYRRLFRNLVKTLVQLRESRDPYAKGHTRRVVELSLKLGKLACLDDEALKKLELAASVYDIGKIAVSDKILKKEGPLTEEERKEVEKYVLYSVKILSSIEEFQPVLPIVEAHKERPDGKGYPSRLLDEEIPKESKILGLVDAYVAMRSDRPWRKALSQEAAISELEKGKGTQFDGALVSLLLKIIKQENL